MVIFLPPVVDYKFALSFCEWDTHANDDEPDHPGQPALTQHVILKYRPSSCYF